MQPLQPEQAAFLLHGYFLPTLKQEHRATKAVIQAIPLDKGDYRPDNIAKSAADLAWHIAVTEMMFMDAVMTGEFDFSPRPRPDSVRNSADILAWYTGEFNSRVDKLAGIPAEKLAKIVDFRGAFQLPAVMFLGVQSHHSVHHRGQLSTYLRPMGAKVPAIYGESYDTAEARKASQKGA